jgi:hypothetical protein
LKKEGVCEAAFGEVYVCARGNDGSKILILETVLRNKKDGDSNKYNTRLFTYGIYLYKLRLLPNH